MEFLKKRIIEMLEDATEEEIRIIFAYIKALLW